MPHIFNFNDCLEEIHTVEVNPKGWKGPLIIEYSVAQNSKYDTQLSLVWRIKGTEHTFSIYQRRLNVISNGNYKKHFEQALEGFREDYLSWFSDDQYKDAEWKYDYQRQYGNIIIPKSSRNNKN